MRSKGNMRMDNKDMKIFVDLTALTDKPTGIARVAESVAKAMIRKHPEHHYVLAFWNEVPKRFLVDHLGSNVEVICIKTGYRTMRLKDLPLAMYQSKADFFLCCAFPSPITLWDKRAVSVIHDLTPFDYGETMAKDAMRTWRLLIRHAVRTNGLILHVSHTVMKEVQKKFHCRKVAVIPNGVDIAEQADTSVLDKFNLEKNTYILSVSTLEPRKNLKFLLKAFAMLDNKSDIKLVLTGGKGWKLEDAIGAVPPEVEKNVVFTGYVSDEELKALYQNANCFVSSSVYEGFGLPVIEAVKNDLPVVISDIPVYREITNNKAVYFGLENPETLKKCIEQAITTNMRETEQFAQLKVFAAQYTWDNYAEELNHLLLERIMQNG